MLADFLEVRPQEALKQVEWQCKVAELRKLRDYPKIWESVYNTMILLELYIVIAEERKKKQGFTK